MSFYSTILKIKTKLKQFKLISLFSILLISLLTFSVSNLTHLNITKAQASFQGYYVDQAIGNDTNNGSNNSPFKSIEKARDTATSISSSMTGNIDIFVSGVYKVANPIDLTAINSGKNGFKIQYLSNPSNPGTIHGANIYNNGWTDNGNGIYQINLGNLAEAPREIYLNGMMQTRSTSEGDGYTFNQTGVHQVNVTSGQNISGWNNLNDIELEGVALNYWKHTIEKVSSVNGIAINLLNASGLPNVDAGFKSSYLVNIRNAFELITKDGEWYYNKSNNNLYMKSSSNPNGLELAVPISEGLFKINGASNVTFDSLTFKYSAWNTIPNKIGVQTMGQGGVVNKNMNIGSFNQDIMDGAIQMNYAQNIDFNNNRFQDLASFALACKDGCKNQNITTNEFLNMGGGAMIYGNVNGHDINSEINTINIKNNLIKNTGVEYYGATALSFIYGKSIIIDRNDITETSYSPIAIGWGWNSASNQLENNKVTNNRISTFMTKVFDGAGVYTLSNQPGTEISNNYIYDAKHDYGGIYPDEGSSKIKIDSNVIDTGQTFWLYIWSNDKMFDLSITNNFIKSYTCNTNFGSYSTRNDLCEITRGTNTTYTNNTAVTGNWPTAAQTIINNSGRQSSTNITSSATTSSTISSSSSIIIPNTSSSTTINSTSSNNTTSVTSVTSSSSITDDCII